MRDTLTVMLSAIAIGTVIYVLLTEVWFHNTLMGRALAILILSATYYGVFIAGVCQGIGMVNDDV